jgi:hypothetical protein
LISAHQEEDAINQPQYNTFSKDVRPRNAEQTQTRDDDVSNEQDCVVIAYDDQNQQLVQIGNQFQYAQQSHQPTSGVIINNLHSYT